MSIHLPDDEVPQIVSLISAERLSTFTRITGSERDAILLHQQSLRVAGALMPTTAMVEIVLRNAICDALRDSFGRPDWLLNPPAPFQWKGEETENIKRCSGWARRAVYANLSQAQKKALDTLAFPQGVPAGTSHEKRSKDRQRHIQITAGQLIAQLTLMFWKRLFSPDYENHLWKRSLRGLFPNKLITRPQVAQNLEVIYQTRNRIAHHEPVIGERLTRVSDAIDFIVLNFRSRTPSEDAILARLTQPYRRDLADQISTMGEMLTPFVVPPPGEP